MASFRAGLLPAGSAAYAVVHTLEDQPFGCFILHKGVIF